MARRGRRKRLGPKGSKKWRGLWRDGSGYSIVLRVRGILRERRFPPDTPQDVLLEERDKFEGYLLSALPIIPTRGTFAADVTRVLRQIPQGPSHSTRRAELAAWTEHFGSRRRYAITAPDIRRTLATWLNAGVSPSTVNKRLSALRALYRDLATHPSDPNPARHVSKVAEDEPTVRSVDRALLERLIDAMPDRGRPEKGNRKRAGGTGRSTVNLAKLRLRVMHWTGLPPATLKRVQLEDLRLDDPSPSFYVRPRRKGKGAKGVWLPLFPQAVHALRALLDAGGLVSGKGTPFSQHAVNHAFQRACRRLRAADPRVPHLTPYQLRHSFLDWLASVVKDERIVQMYAQHADIRTTQRYTRRSVDPRLAFAFDLAQQTLTSDGPQVGTHGLPSSES